MSGGLDFNDFLSEMTGTPKAPVQQERRPQPKKPAPAPVQEDLEDEDWEEEVEEDEDLEVESKDDFDDLDVVGRALEYSSIVLKTIRQTFDKKDQMKVLETLRSSINSVLGESSVSSVSVLRPEPQMRQRTEESRQAPRQQSQKSASPMMAAPTLSEDVYNRMTPEQLEAYERGTYDPFQGQQQQAPAQQRQPQRQQSSSKARVDESRNRTYNKDLDLGMKMGVDGKPEVDLSNVSDQDIADMKILMGL